MESMDGDCSSKGGTRLDVRRAVGLTGSFKLYHALMAFSALSMSYKNGVPNLDALQHYQQALPSLQCSLRTEQDLTSDGVFLTHFILLLYEVNHQRLMGQYPP